MINNQICLANTTLDECLTILVSCTQNLPLDKMIYQQQVQVEWRPTDQLGRLFVYGISSK